MPVILYLHHAIITNCNLGRLNVSLIIGYSSSHKGYKCLASNGRLYISKDVLFNESHFHFQHRQTNANSNPPPMPSPSHSIPLAILPPDSQPQPEPLTPHTTTPTTPFIPSLSLHTSFNSNSHNSLRSTSSPTIDPDSSPSTSRSPPPPTNIHPMHTQFEIGCLKPPVYPTISLTTSEPVNIQ